MAMDLHLYLRNGTRALHQRTEALLAMDESTITAQHYRRFLVVMGAAHERFAPGIASIEGAYGGDVDRLWTALKQDLDTDHRMEKSIADASAPPLSVAHRWGHAYVLTGSSLGASVIRKRVSRCLPGSTPSRYLEHCAAGARRQWPSFLKALNDSCVNKTEALAGATDAFEFVASRFAGAGQ